MSSEIFYDKAFIRVEEKYIPVVNHGSSNCFEFDSRGREIPEKTWSVLNHPYTERMLFTADEIREIADFYEEINMSNRGGTKKSRNRSFEENEFRRWILAGMKSAHTVEEYMEFGNRVIIIDYSEDRWMKYSVPTTEALLDKIQELADRQITVGFWDTNQRKLLINYYESHPDLKKYQIIEFCDDGFSGTNFDRPQFTRMIEMLRNREIDAVMVKDLSRFGRDHLEVGGYLELLFPLFGTRFISVNDNFDTNDYVGTTGGLELAIRNLVNGMYSKDLSLKIRSANQARRKQGFYHSCGHAFYGYQLDPKDKRKLIVDENVRQVVVRIFDLCIAGQSTKSIAQHLNDQKIPSPRQYKLQNGMFYNGRVVDGESIWLASTIRKILSDERYTGKMISNTREMVGIRTNKSRALPREQWIVVENTHEAIISEEKFQAAAVSLASRIKTVNMNTSGNRAGNLFVCGYCGRKLQKAPAIDTHLFCLKASSQNQAECAAIHESLEVLQDKTLSVVQAIARILLDKSKFEKKYDVTEQAQLERLIADMERRRRQIANGKSSLYEEYRNGHISRERFVKIQSDNKAEDERLQQKIAEKNVVLNECIQKQKALALAGQDAEQIQALTEYRPEVISRLIDKVRVFEGGRIEIGLKSKYLTDIIGECIPGLAS